MWSLAPPTIIRRTAQAHSYTIQIIGDVLTDGLYSSDTVMHKETIASVRSCYSSVM